MNRTDGIGRDEKPMASLIYEKLLILKENEIRLKD
jgi:hypothetical protein